MSLKNALYLEVSLGSFQNAFTQKAPDNFSRDGMEILFNHLQLIAREPTKLDVYQVIQDYEEVSAANLISEKGFDLQDVDEDDLPSLIEYLRDNDAYIGHFLNKHSQDYHFIIRKF